MIKEVFENFYFGLKGDIPILIENKYSLMILLIFITSIIVSIIYKMDKTKIINKKLPQTHLFQETLNTLVGSDRKICEFLGKTEGILKEALVEDLGLNDIEVKDSLKRLEKRQVIKERKDANSKIYLNDWLK